MPGTSVADLRDSDPNAALGSTADVTESGRSQGGSKLGVKSSEVVSYQVKGAGKQAAVIRQVSSGLLTSAGPRNEGSGETRPMPVASVAREWSAVPLVGTEQPAASETPPAACQGHEAAVAQKVQTT